MLRFLFVFPLALLIVATGCSSGPRVAPVKGKVTVGGKPVTTGQITFHSEGGRPAIGEIDAEGNYTLTTFKQGDGAIVGKHTVTIHATKVGGGSMGFASPEDEMRWTEQGMKKGGSNKILVPGKVEWLVPEKYSRSESSDLKKEVKEGENIINFDL